MNKNRINNTRKNKLGQQVRSLIAAPIIPQHDPERMEGLLGELVSRADVAILDNSMIATLEPTFETHENSPGESGAVLLRTIIEQVSAKKHHGLECAVTRATQAMHDAAIRRLHLLAQSRNVIMTARAAQETQQTIAFHQKLSVENGFANTDNRGLRRTLIDTSLDFGLALKQFIQTLASEGRIQAYQRQEDLSKIAETTQLGITDVENVYLALNSGARSVALLTYDRDHVFLARCLYLADGARRAGKTVALEGKHPLRGKRLFLGIRGVTSSGLLAENIGFSFGGCTPFIPDFYLDQGIHGTRRATRVAAALIQKAIIPAYVHRIERGERNGKEHVGIFRLPVFGCGEEGRLVTMQEAMCRQQQFSRENNTPQIEAGRKYLAEIVNPNFKGGQVLALAIPRYERGDVVEVTATRATQRDIFSGETPGYDLLFKQNGSGPLHVGDSVRVRILSVELPQIRRGKIRGEAIERLG